MTFVYTKSQIEMKKALITGANKSIGLETARQLLQKGYYVYLGSRDLQQGRKAVEELKAEGLNEVEAIQLDVSDQQSVNAARAEIGKRTEVLDALINNAGVSGEIPQSALGLNVDKMHDVFNVNLYGVIRVTQAFIDLLQKASQPRIVMVSSLSASMVLNNDPGWKYYHHKAAVYQPSKAALNMYTINLAYELRDTAFKVNAVDPGFVATDFNHHRGTGTVKEAGARIAKYALIGEEGPTGMYISEEQNPESGQIPW
jgi:NAD(P)-dependent dehydrogenase (short-subunit alcohol dehydrogenase family)